MRGAKYRYIHEVYSDDLREVTWKYFLEFLAVNSALIYRIILSKFSKNFFAHHQVSPGISESKPLDYGSCQRDKRGSIRFHASVNGFEPLLNDSN